MKAGDRIVFLCPIDGVKVDAILIRFHDDGEYVTVQHVGHGHFYALIKRSDIVS